MTPCIVLLALVTLQPVVVIYSPLPHVLPQPPAAVRVVPPAGEPLAPVKAGTWI